MKKIYESPLFELEIFTIADVITTSTDEGIESGGETDTLNSLYSFDGSEF